MEVNATKCIPASVDPDDISKFRWFGIVVGCFDIIVGGIGNGLTIAAFASNKKLWNTFNIFVINLSLIDFMTAVVMMPMNVLGYALEKWPFEPWTCRVQAYFYLNCGYISVCCLMSITVNRLIGIVFPLHYKRYFSRARVICIIVLCWTLSPALLSPFLLIRNDDNDEYMIGWKEDQNICTFNNLTNSTMILYMKFIRVLFQFLPAIAMTLSYSIAVFDVAYFGQIPISLTSRAIPSQGVRFSVATLSNNNDQPRARRSGHWRLLIISVLMCTVFTLLFIPSVVVNLLDHSECFDPRIHMGCSIMTWFNSCSNPIIYCLLYPRFQREYKRLLKCNSVVRITWPGSSSSTGSTRKSPRFSSFSSSRLGVGVLRLYKMQLTSQLGSI